MRRRPVRRVVRHGLVETRLLARNGEQLLLALVIPLAILIVGGLLGGRFGDLTVLAPSVLALAIWSSAFTSVAIATGFERRYGVLERLAATPLGKPGLLVGKVFAIVLVVLGQLVILSVAALALGWRPAFTAVSLLGSVALAVLATATFTALALLLAGRLRAEVTLALANVIYVVLLAGGGLVIPVDRYPAALRPLIDLLPTAALGEGLRAGRPGSVARLAAAGVDRLVGGGRVGRRKGIPMDLLKQDPPPQAVHTGGDAVTQLTRPLRGPVALRRWAVASLVANIVIVVTGALVRLTGSGLGCPTWPRCTDESYVTHPALGYHGAIEFGNRLLTFALVIVAVLTWASAFLARTDGRRRRDLRWLAAGMAFGIPVQAVIGGISVLMQLNPFVVAVHLLVSMVLIALSVWLVRRTRALPLCRSVRAWSSWLG